MSVLLAKLAGLVPARLVRPLAMRYVAGETVDAALAAARRLSDAGYAGVVNLLGEFAGAEDARQIAAQYVDLLGRIAADGLNCDISVKLTQLGLTDDERAAHADLEQILTAARSAGRFVRVDMEASPYTDRTLEIVAEFRRQGHEVGTVLQSMLKRSVNDATTLGGTNVRVCKGAYREPPDIAWQDSAKINENFVEVVRACLDSGAYVAAATHDRGLIKQVREILPPDRGEFQVLLGVPMGGLLEDLKRTHIVRVYIPFGPAWHDYCMRRIRENPQIIRHVIRNLFHRKDKPA